MRNVPARTVLTFLLSWGLITPALAGGKAKHVIVIVWDGMRPDFISEENTPTLFQLAHSGVFFSNHHPVYISSTEVNGASIATGAYPAQDGIIANMEFRPEIDPEKPFHTEDFDAIRKGDELSHGHYVEVPTIAEILRHIGMKTEVTGAKGVALLHDRLERAQDSDSVTLFAGRTIPAGAQKRMVDLYGAFPAAGNLVPTRNDWTTSALLKPLWQNGIPAFSLLWMNEPDASQHATGPGSPRSLEAMKNSDDNLARVLHALDAASVRDQTDILLVSDHGFSTIQSIVDVAESLGSAGLKATHEFKTPPAKGDILTVDLGGSTLLYVTGHDQEVINRAVKVLQGRSYTGVIFTRQPMPGTFTMAQGHVDSHEGPDIIVSFRWSDAKSDFGTPGMLASDSAGYLPGQGMHGSLSRFDMHNTFVAAGPDFRHGVVDALPTGNVDIAPTALWLLGIKPPKTMSGRVVMEAMNAPDSKIKSYTPNHIEATSSLEKGTWHQYLNFSEVNGVIYFDEGNGYQDSD